MVELNPVQRDRLEAFIRDQRTVFDFEALFAAVIEMQSYMARVGDIVYSAGTERAQALPANGAAVSRTTYATLFAAIGTQYGVGDGSTTFNLPNLAGRVVAGKEAAATLITTAVSGFSGATLGATGGAQSHQLTAPEMPVHTHTGTTSSDGTHTHSLSQLVLASTGVYAIASGALLTMGDVAPTALSAGAHTHTMTTASAGGTAGVTVAHRNMQPTIILNAFILY